MKARRLGFILIALVFICGQVNAKNNLEIEFEVDKETATNISRYEVKTSSGQAMRVEHTVASSSSDRFGFKLPIRDKFKGYMHVFGTTNGNGMNFDGKFSNNLVLGGGIEKSSDNQMLNLYTGIERKDYQWNLGVADRENNTVMHGSFFKSRNN